MCNMKETGACLHEWGFPRRRNGEESAPYFCSAVSDWRSLGSCIETVTEDEFEILEFRFTILDAGQVDLALLLSSGWVVWIVEDRRRRLGGIALVFGVVIYWRARIDADQAFCNRLRDAD